MENTSKKCFKKSTTYAQFQKLVGLMEKYPHLATGIPPFGSSRADIEKTWDTVARIVNSIGPPERNKHEWKKTWADLKFRTKKSIADNSKSFNDSDDCGSSRLRTLTPLELDIVRICHLSSASAIAGGEVCEVANDDKATKSTTSKTSATQIVAAEKPQPNKTTSHELSNTLPKSKTVTSTPNQHQPPSTYSTRRTLQQRKRKLCNDKNYDKTEQMKLLRQQVDLQHTMLNYMRLQAESAEASAEALQDIAESTKLMAEAMMAVAKHFTGNEYI